MSNMSSVDILWADLLEYGFGVSNLPETPKRLIAVEVEEGMAYFMNEKYEYIPVSTGRQLEFVKSQMLSVIEGYKDQIEHSENLIYDIDIAKESFKINKFDFRDVGKKVIYKEFITSAEEMYSEITEELDRFFFMEEIDDLYDDNGNIEIIVTFAKIKSNKFLVMIEDGDDHIAMLAVNNYEYDAAEFVRVISNVRNRAVKEIREKVKIKIEREKETITVKISYDD